MVKENREKEKSSKGKSEKETIGKQQKIQEIMNWNQNGIKIRQKDRIRNKYITLINLTCFDFISASSEISKNFC